MNDKRLFQILTSTEAPPLGATTVFVELKFPPQSEVSIKAIHDLQASINALRMTLQMNHEAILEPSPRDLKKIAQMNAHMERIERAIQDVCQLIAGSSSP